MSDELWWKVVGNDVCSSAATDIVKAATERMLTSGPRSFADVAAAWEHGLASAGLVEEPHRLVIGDYQHEIAQVAASADPALAAIANGAWTEVRSAWASEHARLPNARELSACLKPLQDMAWTDCFAEGTVEVESVAVLPASAPTVISRQGSTVRRRDPKRVTSPYINESMLLYVLADGVGNYRAAQAAGEAVGHTVAIAMTEGRVDGVLSEGARRAVETAHDQDEAGSARVELVAVWIRDDHAHVVATGTCAVYRLRGDEVAPLAGAPLRDAAPTGPEDGPHVEARTVDHRAGDTFLLCTGGARERHDPPPLPPGFAQARPLIAAVGELTKGLDVDGDAGIVAVRIMP